MGLDYVDIFYHHRPDPETPLEETMGALDYIVRSGRALYAGISNYKPDETREAARILRQLGTPCLIHQPSTACSTAGSRMACSTSSREEGIGCIVFSPLAQGLLTDRYLGGIPEDSRAGRPTGFLRPQHVTEERVAKVRKLNELAQARGQTMAQMAIAWVLRQPAVTSALIGASRPAAGGGHRRRAEQPRLQRRRACPDRGDPGRVRSEADDPSASRSSLMCPRLLVTSALGLHCRATTGTLL